MPTEKNILSFIPQRPPFVMTGELLSATDQVTITTYVIAKENILVDGGVFTEAGLLENMAQTAAAGAGYKAVNENRPVLKGYIGAVKNFEIFALPEVNDKLKTEVTETGKMFNMQTVEGKVWRGNELLAQCELKIFLEEEN
ncbi:MAG: 3-hydroxyacyl-ACP dehydratase [Ferruginibacter sp.]